MYRDSVPICVPHISQQKSSLSSPFMTVFSLCFCVAWIRNGGVLVTTRHAHILSPNKLSHIAPELLIFFFFLLTNQEQKNNLVSQKNPVSSLHPCPAPLLHVKHRTSCCLFVVSSTGKNYELGKLQFPDSVSHPSGRLQVICCPWEKSEWASEKARAEPSIRRGRQQPGRCLWRAETRGRTFSGWLSACRRQGAATRGRPTPPAAARARQPCGSRARGLLGGRYRSIATANAAGAAFNDFCPFALETGNR